MSKARDDLRAARLALSRDPSSPISRRLWKEKQVEFCERIADINVKVDRLNMIVPTLYQQIARFDVVRELETITEQCLEQYKSEPVSTYRHGRESVDESGTVTLTDVWRQLKTLFTTWIYYGTKRLNKPAEIWLFGLSECEADCRLLVIMHVFVTILY